MTVEALPGTPVGSPRNGGDPRDCHSDEDLNVKCQSPAMEPSPSAEREDAKQIMAKMRQDDVCQKKELMGFGALLPELRAQISSYLDVSALLAERTTSKGSSSWKAEAFVAQLVQLVRPETPDVLMAAADIYTSPEKRQKMAECEQALARDSFQVFAGFKCAQCIFQQADPPYKLWWASNPEAMTHLLACWTRHSSLDSTMQFGNARNYGSYLQESRLGGIACQTNAGRRSRTIGS